MVSVAVHRSHSGEGAMCDLKALLFIQMVRLSTSKAISLVLDGMPGSSTYDLVGCMEGVSVRSVHIVPDARLVGRGCPYLLDNLLVDDAEVPFPSHQ